MILDLIYEWVKTQDWGPDIKHEYFRDPDAYQYECDDEEDAITIRYVDELARVHDVVEIRSGCYVYSSNNSKIIIYNWDDATIGELNIADPDIFDQLHKLVTDEIQQITQRYRAYFDFAKVNGFYDHVGMYKAQYFPSLFPKVWRIRQWINNWRKYIAQEYAIIQLRNKMAQLLKEEIEKENSYGR